MMKNLYKKSPIWLLVLVSTLVFAFYQAFIISDRYISEAHVVLESPQIAAPELSFQSLLGGAGGGSKDMLLLRDYLRSVDMLKIIDKKLDFRQHYASSDIDFLSVLGSVDPPMEELHEYYLSRISIELDDYAGVLRIRVAAFTPEMSKRIASLMLEGGEQYMNLLGQRLAEEQVGFLEKQVDGLATKLEQSRQHLIDYQNKHGLISPQGMLENINQVIASLEAQLASLRAKKTAMLTYQSTGAESIRSIDAEINAYIKQIQEERSRMTETSGDALNVVTSEYQKLELKMQFAQETYSGALAALENTRIEAARKLKQISILQSPTLPEYPIEPRRIHNSIVFALMAIFLGLIMQMLLLVIDDHRD